MIDRSIESPFTSSANDQSDSDCDCEEMIFEAFAFLATFIYPFCAPEGIEYAYKIATGEKVPDHVVLKSTRVDTSNIDKYLGKGF